MKPIIDARRDVKTAARISEALRLQSHHGHDRAIAFLRSSGIDPELAQRVLAVRFERRRSAIALQGIGESGGDWGLAVRVP